MPNILIDYSLLPGRSFPTSAAERFVQGLRLLCLAPFVFLALVTSASATPIVSVPNLSSVSIFESTGVSPGQFTFAPTGPELTMQLSDPLDSANNDFTGAANEFYDVFYSDAAGTFDASGTHITVTARFDSPGQSGLNLSEVVLSFSDGAVIFGDVVSASTTHGVVGSEAFPEIVFRAADGDLSTHTFMGQTTGQAQDVAGRLSVTVGFSTIPEPGTATLILSGLLLLSSTRRP